MERGDPSLYYGTKQQYFGRVNFNFTGGGNPPLRKTCYKKRLRKTKVKCSKGQEKNNLSPLTWAQNTKSLLPSSRRGGGGGRCNPLRFFKFTFFREYKSRLHVIIFTPFAPLSQKWIKIWGCRMGKCSPQRSGRGGGGGLLVKSPKNKSTIL